MIEFQVEGRISPKLWIRGVPGVFKEHKGGQSAWSGAEGRETTCWVLRSLLGLWLLFWVRWEPLQIQTEEWHDLIYFKNTLTFLLTKKPIGVQRWKEESWEEW